MASSGVFLIIKNLVFTVVAPGTVTILLPYVVASNTGITPPVSMEVPQFLAMLPGAAGLAIYFWCLWDFAVIGRGTPAPIDAPKVLIAVGLYRYVRNPMYLGIVMIVLAEAIFVQSMTLLAYAMVWWLVVHLFVTLYEEPHLRATFGESYRQYQASVRRWLPGRRYANHDQQHA